MKILQLTDEEIQVLAGLLDIAVKSAGIAVAKNAVHLLNKLELAEEVEDGLSTP